MKAGVICFLFKKDDEQRKRAGREIKMPSNRQIDGARTCRLLGRGRGSVAMRHGKDTGRREADRKRNDQG